MTTPQIVAVVVAFVLMDLIIISTVIYAVTGSVRELAKRYPPHPPRPDAVVKRMQSFRFGMCKLGGCITAAVDEDCLHLTPNRFGRIFGAKAMSLPWDAIEVKGTRWKRTTAMVAGTQIMGPAWCFEVAAPVDSPLR